MSSDLGTELKGPGSMFQKPPRQTGTNGNREAKDLLARHCKLIYAHHAHHPSVWALLNLDLVLSSLLDKVGTYYQCSVEEALSLLELFSEAFSSMVASLVPRAYYSPS
ncbi:hypothetical protein KIL84_008391 [Mauremys mutica]|uniref:Uncharacterized protein n=1 Tax=Mauremys mutica TaxID=74926 RepID=A0A9D3X9Q6_9SAUR|nr:hypothetical protein KIL84_008391 [Mauremys mutica]